MKPGAVSLARVYGAAAAVQILVLCGLAWNGAIRDVDPLVAGLVAAPWLAATAANATAYVASRRRGPALVTLWFLCVSIVCAAFSWAALDAPLVGDRSELAALVIAGLMLLWPLAARSSDGSMLALIPTPSIGLVAALVGGVLGAVLLDDAVVLECTVASVLGLAAAEHLRDGIVGGALGMKSRGASRHHARLAALVLLLAFGAVHAAAAVSPALVRGPYLQRLTQRSVTVVWRTATPAACSLAIRPEGGTPRIVEGPTASACVIDVPDLDPGVRYEYVPRADGSPLGDARDFRTDGTQSRFTFLVFGDSGCGCPTQFAVRDRMLESPADFLLHTGDMVYRKVLRPDDFDTLIFDPYRALMSRVVLWPCLGNHDRQRDDGAIWRDVFLTPANNPEGAEDYYSFDYGNAHVVVLDSNAPTGRKSAQRRFLDRDLAASAAPWKFVVLHHTLYSSGRHGGAKRIRRNLVPIFDAHRVSVVFMGHDHSYERTKPLRDGRVVAPGAGTVYVTTGGGGKSIRPVGRSAFTAFAESAFHFVRVTIADDTVELEMVRADGAVRDRVALPRRSS